VESAFPQRIVSQKLYMIGKSKRNLRCLF